MKKPGKAFWIPVLILIIALMVFFNLRKGSNSGSDKGEVAVVELGGVIDRLTETGTIELVRTVEVKSKVSGRIKAIRIEEGDPVQAEQVLAVVEPDPNQALMLYGKRAAVDRARIEYLEKEKELERQRELFDKSLISRQDVERMENLYRLSVNAYKQALLEQRILEMEMAEASQTPSLEELDPASLTELDDYRILAPISGLLIRRHVEVGEMVVTGVSSYMVGSTVFEIGDPSEMIVAASISEVDVGQLRTGQRVEIVADTYPDLSYRGRVKHIAPVGQIKPGDSIVTFDVEIEILDADERLRQGMSCDIDIIFAHRDSVPVLPVEAVHEVFSRDAEGEETTRVDSVLAFRWNGEGFDRVRVETGLESSRRVEILAGLEEGDEVALNATERFNRSQKREEEEEKEE